MTEDARAYALDNLRAELDAQPGITEKRMFGGTFFMLNGNMLCGIGKRGYMFRVGEAQEAEALEKPGAERVNNGRDMPGFVHVAPDAAIETGLGDWVMLARAYVGAMPAKQGKQ